MISMIYVIILISHKSYKSFKITVQTTDNLKKWLEKTNRFQFLKM